MTARFRRLSVLITGLLTLWIGPATAGTYCLRAKCKKEKRLAPELALVKNANSRFHGMCRDGKAVIEVPDTQVHAMQTMAAAVDTDIPKAEERSHRLLLSYSGPDNKPSNETLQAAGLRLVEDYEPGSFLVVEPVEVVTSTTVETLMSDAAVAYAAPDYIMSVPKPSSPPDIPVTMTSTVPNDPMLAQLWGMKNCGATQVWPTLRESPKVVVAVIDTGVDYSHPDLKDNIWTRNGVHGYDFYDNDADPMDEEGHGTHCAGTIAASGNNAVGVVGVTWKTQIMCMRFLGPDGSGATSDAVRCIDWAVANGAHILSNSWAGIDNAPELLEAVNRAQQKGVLFVAAAGNTGGSGNNNDSRPYYPASLPSTNIISVAAIDTNDARGSFSHYGKQSVDIGAPGVGILSTTVGENYQTLSGTSMAAPHVSGAAALVWAASFTNPAQDPNQMTKVRDLIYEHARPVPALKDWWGYAAPAKVPGGVLDISFLAQTSPGPTTPVVQKPVRRRLVENRMIVDPSRLR